MDGFAHLEDRGTNWLLLVQEKGLWGTNQVVSGIWYRGWPSGVPTEGGTIVGTEKPPQEYND